MSRRSWFWLGVSLATVLLAGGGGWWLGHRSVSCDKLASDEITAFLRIRDGLFVTNQQIEAEIESILYALEERSKLDTACATIFRKALAVHDAAVSGYGAIGDAYLAIVVEGAGSDERNPATGYPEVYLDRSGTNYVMLSRGMGKQLRDSLEKARQGIAHAYPASMREYFLNSLALQVEDIVTGDGDSISWEEDNFQDLPRVAALAVLAKLMNDLRQSEYATIQYLKSQVGIENPEFSVLRAETKTERNGSADIKVFLTGAPTAVLPKVFIGTLNRELIGTDSSGRMKLRVDGLDAPPLLAGYRELHVESDGSAKFALSGKNSNYSGVIELLNLKTGRYTYYPFESK